VKFAVVVHRRSATSDALVAAALGWGFAAEILDPHQTLALLEPVDVVLARLDVRAELDGIERGTGELERLAAGGVDVRNPPGALVVAHDKLLTARTLRLAGLPHPHTILLSPALPAVVLELPLVLKPRFGSWGRDVELCSTPTSSRPRSCGCRQRRGSASTACSPRSLSSRAAGICASSLRVAASSEPRAVSPRAGEWWTNAALGAQVEPTDAPPLAQALAVAAARTARADLVGVDLLPTRHGFVVLELNEAVDFRPV
jgi:glutathione synthase/RimK-type ligase-like ATP-grasp enzyme